MGRIAARRLVARVAGCKPGQVRLEVADDGAVDIVGHDLSLSISHTDDAAVAAVSPGPIGIDIEPAARDIADLKDYVLNADEQERLLRDHDLSIIIRSWVAKESVLKAMRSGLRTSPLDLTLRFADGGGYARHANGSAWAFSMEERRGFLVAVAVPDADAALR